MRKQSELVLKSFYLCAKILFRLFQSIRSRLIIADLRASGCKVGDNVVIKWPAKISIDRDVTIEIGNDVTIDAYSDIIVGKGAKLFIGNNVYIGKRNVISSTMNVHIGDNSFTAHDVTIIDSDHRFKSNELPIRSQGHTANSIIIDDNVWLASNVTVLKGVKIGRRTVIAAHSLVNRSVESGHLVGGLPGKVICKI